MKQFGNATSNAIDWAAPRLLCIAGDFKKFDEHAVRQINRNIELIRYKRFGADLVLLDLVNATSTENGQAVVESSKSLAKQLVTKTIDDRLRAASVEVQDRFAALEAYAMALGDDVQRKTLKHYFAFRRLRNFACVEVHPSQGQITLYLKVEPTSVTLEQGFVRDVRKIGHYGTGDLEVIIRNDQQLESAKPLILRSYESA